MVWQIDRREFVENIYRSRDGILALEPHNFDVPGWPSGEEELYTPILFDCLDRGGTAWAVREKDKVVAAAVLESKFIGTEHDTLQLKFLHVSRDHRTRGLGTTLFQTAAERAKELGAAKLYISATPSQKTINFYLRLGCVVASEVDPELFALEPKDIHLEYMI